MLDLRQSAVYPWRLRPSRLATNGSSLWDNYRHKRLPRNLLTGAVVTRSSLWVYLISYLIALPSLPLILDGMLPAGAAVERNTKGVTSTQIKSTLMINLCIPPAKPPGERGKRGEFHLFHFKHCKITYRFGS